MHPSASYWNAGVDRVPGVTGAAALLDAADVRGLCAELGIALPFGSLLDVGCGTGRVAPLATTYRGLDVASDCVAYCRQRGLPAEVIEGAPSLLVGFTGRFDWIVALSVFTHIDLQERRDYLRAFPAIADQWLIDIIPGTGAGSVSRWTADVPGFEQDLAAAGARIVGTAERLCPGGGGIHRYYRCEVAR